MLPTENHTTLQILQVSPKESLFPTATEASWFPQPSSKACPVLHLQLATTMNVGHAAWTCDSYFCEKQAFW